MFYLGIDLGTSSVKLLLMNEKGLTVASTTEEYDVFYPHTGWAEQNPNDWFKATCDGIKKLISNNKINAAEIDGISFSGQMHGLVIVDKNGDIIRPAILWCDQRTEAQCDYLNNVIGQEKISKLTGNKALTGFTAPKVLWVKENEPENFSKIYKVLLPKDFINYKLSGIFASDVSDASGTLFFDVKNRCWSKEMLEILHMKEEWLPKVFESSSVTGTVSKEASLLTGLNEGTKIIAGAGDQAAGAIGTGIVEPGILSVALGTSGVVFTASDTYIVDNENRLHSFCDASSKYHQMGVMLCAAQCLKWWTEDVNNIDFDILLNEAEKSPVGSNGVIFLPYLMGERTPYSDANARGVFFGMSVTSTRGDLTRAILEGVSFALRDSLEIIKDMKMDVIEVRVSGGGARSYLWRSILSDIFNTKVSLINSQDGPAYGAAILASVGAGLYSSVTDACKSLISVKETIEPNIKNISRYDAIYDLYKDLYPNLKDSFKKLSKLNNV
jgi:xylulokinase